MAFLRKYATGTGSNVIIPMIKAGVSDFATNSDWTPVAGDVKISIDGGSQNNITSLPTYANGDWIFTFSNAELTGKMISVRIVDTAPKSVEDSGFNIETYGNASAQIIQDLSAANYNAQLDGTQIWDNDVTTSKLFYSLIAMLVGKVSVTDNGSTRTIRFIKQDGSTEAFNVTVAESDGTRTTTGTIT